VLCLFVWLEQRPISVSSTHGNLGSPVLPYFLPSSHSSSANNASSLSPSRNDDRRSASGSVHSTTPIDGEEGFSNTAVSTLRLDESPWVAAAAGADSQIRAPPVGFVGKEKEGEGGGVDGMMSRWKGEDALEIEMGVVDGYRAGRNDGELTLTSDLDGKEEVQLPIVGGGAGKTGVTPKLSPDHDHDNLAPSSSPSSNSPASPASPIPFAAARPAIVTLNSSSSSSPFSSDISLSAQAQPQQQHDEEHHDETADGVHMTKTQKKNARRRAKAKEDRKAKEADGLVQVGGKESLADA
jgi:hypothetical protein